MAGQPVSMDTFQAAREKILDRDLIMVYTYRLVGFENSSRYTVNRSTCPVLSRNATASQCAVSLSATLAFAFAGGGQ